MHDKHYTLFIAYCNIPPINKQSESKSESLNNHICAAMITNRNCVAHLCVLTALLAGEAFSSKLESNFYAEEPCTARKGLCVLENECSGEVGEDLRGLCNFQRSKGAICCTEIELGNANCNQLHNNCQTNCPSSLSLGRKGCSEGLTCCLLI